MENPSNYSNLNLEEVNLFYKSLQNSLCQIKENHSGLLGKLKTISNSSKKALENNIQCIRILESLPSVRDEYKTKEMNTTLRYKLVSLIGEIEEYKENLLRTKISKKLKEIRNKPYIKFILGNPKIP